LDKSFWLEENAYLDDEIFNAKLFEVNEISAILSSCKSPTQNTIEGDDIKSIAGELTEPCNSTIE